jgi:hypothetical protein
MSSPHSFPRFIVAALAFSLCGGPQLMSAQQTAPVQNQAAPEQQTNDQQNNTQQTQPDASQAADQQNGGQQNVGTSQDSATPDPSKGPLKPNDNQLPNAPSTSQQQQPTSGQNKQPESKETPLGAAAAQAGKASGGAASRPAGIAIAPAKQHQTRSLLIKVGAVAAGAAAVGIVYGLSRGTPSVPPGATTTAAAH